MSRSIQKLPAASSSFELPRKCPACSFLHGAASNNFQLPNRCPACSLLHRAAAPWRPPQMLGNC
eukprot:2719615-Alexandrium_andersonii.AAC.1